MAAPPIDINSRRGDRSERWEFPHNLEAEAGVLGGVLIDNAVLAEIADLEPDDFYDHKHKFVFTAMRNLEASSTPIDVITLEVEIEKQGRLDAIGGVGFLGELVARVPTAFNVLEYKNTVRVHATNRRVMVRLAAAAERARKWPHEATELLDEILGDLERIKADRSIVDGVARKVTYGSPFKEWLGDSEPSNDPSEIFDAHGLIVRGEPGLWLGDPKVGKTLLVTDLALHLAAGRKEWCGVPLYRRCKTLLLLREDSERTTRRRVFQMARGAGIDTWELDGWLEIDGITPLYFDDPKHLAQLRRQLEKFDNVIIDSLSTIHNGDENSVESMAPVMNQWRDMSLTTKTGMPIIHHFRKSPTQGHTNTGGAGGVLARARGSSIIGATTRHAVGISKGPEKHQVVIELESNHDIESDPFVVERRSGTTDRGQFFLTHKRVGSLKDARREADASLVDPIVLKVIRDAGFEGLGETKIRELAKSEMEMTHGCGIGSGRVGQSIRRLSDNQQIQRLDVAKKWRAAP